ncbi:helix-turn-helix transcriptional regulator [Rhodococcus maanshanensis]|uniref:Regulatory protein, luxR family n=1 Tax=Rhodococcus maanshanensis TaxID=183556 RepID=A0A1H7QW74_9NOCA|nr:LuxR family transcriptional regulator [Rhodococcus maanshanensis]SEL51978.1 regulatory protein, luxR family [Rhodococcus maanshanensis]
MNLAWPVIERRAESAAIAEAVGSTDGSRGVLVEGVTGTGKTTLVTSCAAALPRPVRWITGTAASRNRPFGAVRRLVDATSPWTLAALLSDMSRGLSEELTGGSIIVDDAHLLDPLSAALLNQLATARSPTLVVAIRSGEPTPDAVTALWKDRGLGRVTLGCFDRAETETVLATALGGPVESRTVDHIAATTGGNPLHLRRLVEGSLAAGHLRRAHGIWQLREDPAVTAELARHFRERWLQSPPGTRRAVALVAFGEPMTLAVLGDLAKHVSMLGAERTGLVRFAAEGRTVVARLAYPFLGDVIRECVDDPTARRIRGELAARLTGAPDPAERIRAAELSLGSDRPAGARELTAAAADAIALCAFDRAVGLARAAVTDGGGLEAHLVRAAASAGTGRAAEAEELLATLDPTRMAEPDLVLWAMLRAGNLYRNLGSGDRATDLLAATRRRVTTPASRQCLDAARAAIDVRLGHTCAAVQVVERIRDAGRVPPAARMWAASAGCLALSLMGRGSEVPQWSRQTDGLTRWDTSALRFAIGQGEMLALTYTGEFGPAELCARRYLELARNHDDTWYGMSALLGKLELARGRLHECKARLEEAVSGLGRTDPEWRVLANLLLAQCLALLGRPSDGVAAAARAEDAHGESTVLYGADLGITRAWLAAASGDLGRAIGLARRAADQASRHGLHAVEAEAMHSAVRFGDRACGARLRALANVVDGDLIAPMTAQAVAAEAADGDGLLSAASQFDHRGSRLLAADAYAQSAAAYRRAGDRRAELRASTRAYTLARLCGDAQTPAIRAAAGPLPLTPREHEVAVLAAAKLTNHEIADRLEVSTRTIEGHIYHIYMKLEVPDRESLADTILMETTP